MEKTLDKFIKDFSEKKKKIKFSAKDIIPQQELQKLLQEIKARKTKL